MIIIIITVVIIIPFTDGFIIVDYRKFQPFIIIDSRISRIIRF